MTNSASQPARTPARAYSGRSIVALVIAVVALVTPSPFQILVAIVAIVAALAARNELRRNPELRGTVASLSSFLIGVGCLVVSAFPWVLVAVLGAFG